MVVHDDDEEKAPACKMINRLGDVNLSELLVTLNLSDNPEDSYAICWRSVGLSKHQKQREPHPKDPEKTIPMQCFTIDKSVSVGNFVDSLLQDGDNKPCEVTKLGVSLKVDGNLLAGTSLVWQCHTSDQDGMIEFVEDMQSSPCAWHPPFFEFPGGNSPPLLSTCMMIIIISHHLLPHHTRVRAGLAAAARTRAASSPRSTTSEAPSPSSATGPSTSLAARSQ